MLLKLTGSLVLMAGALVAFVTFQEKKDAGPSAHPAVLSPAAALPESDLLRDADLIIADKIRSREWEEAAQGVEAMNGMIGTADLAARVAALRSSLALAVEKELECIRSGLAGTRGALGDAEVDGFLQRFEAIPPDLAEARADLFQACYSRVLAVHVSRLEKQAAAASAENRLGLQNLAASATEFKSAAFGVTDRNSREGLLDRLSSVERRLGDLLLKPGQEAAKAYNLRALASLREANRKYDQNTHWYSDNEPELIKMLITELGPIHVRYLDPATMFVYNEILAQTMNQLDAKQKLQVVEGMTKAAKWPYEEK